MWSYLSFIEFYDMCYFYGIQGLVQLAKSRSSSVIFPTRHSLNQKYLFLFYLQFFPGRTNASSSLFTYSNNETWENYNDPTFDPVYWVSELDLFFPDNVTRLQAVQLCYNASATDAVDPDTEARRPCYYDYGLTLNPEVAQVTGQTFNGLIDEKAIFGEWLDRRYLFYFFFIHNVLFCMIRQNRYL